MTCIDYARDMALVGIVNRQDEHGEHQEVIAAAQYAIDPRSGLAESAIMVSDEYQHRGIGSFLFKYLVQIARENGVKGFTADVLSENSAMLQILSRSGFKVHLEQDGSDVHVSFLFEDQAVPEKKGD
jgi:GNAT superfamily N-acetyltransferase